MYGLNDLVSTNHGSLMCTCVMREGIETYLVLWISDLMTAEVIRTSMCKEIALTMLDEEIKRRTR